MVIIDPMDIAKFCFGFGAGSFFVLFLLIISDLT